MSIIDIIIVFFTCAPIYWILNSLKNEYDVCFKEQEKRDNTCFGSCGGLTGGDKHSEYLSCTCVDCPYLYDIHNMEETK